MVRMRFRFKIPNPTNGRFFMIPKNLVVQRRKGEDLLSINCRYTWEENFYREKQVWEDNKFNWGNKRAENEQFVGSSFNTEANDSKKC